MRDADCCCEPVLSMSEAFEHDQARAREMVREAGRDSVSVTDQLGFSYKLGDTPPRETRPAPRLGENTVELLDEIGISDGERARLVQAGVILVLLKSQLATKLKTKAAPSIQLRLLILVGVRRFQLQVIRERDMTTLTKKGKLSTRRELRSSRGKTLLGKTRLRRIPLAAVSQAR